jgi:hypothetical protein
MHLPELKEKFESRIDYEKWDFETSRNIPLTRKKKMKSRQGFKHYIGDKVIELL